MNRREAIWSLQMKTFVAVAALAVSLAVGGAAVAQPAAAPVPPMAYADRDSRISFEEFSRRAHERFARVDLNRDGRLTRNEARQARLQNRAGRVERTFGADGAMTREDFRARADARFARLDADRNGLLTPEELSARRGERRMARLQGGRPGMRAVRLGRMMGLDGEVTLAEIDAQLRRRFDRRDANDDGVLTPDESGGRRGMGPARRRLG